MSEQTGIEWCDSTFNPWLGCTKVSPACDHCYAERDTRRFGRVEWGAGKPRVRTSAANWKLPERWDREAFAECPECGWRGEFRAAKLVDVEAISQCPKCDCEYLEASRRRVFCASLADWLDNEVPIEWLVDLLDLIRRTPNLDWLLLTKRIGNWRARLREAAMNCKARAMETGEPIDNLWMWISEWANGRNPPANVWLGATVINQDEADRDVPKLLAVPARVRFLSIEPMLGPIRLDIEHDWLGRSAGGPFCPDCPERGVGIDPVDHRGCLGEITDEAPYEGLDWIICGGESGPHARPMHPDWVRSLRDQCAAAGVAFMLKQWGEWREDDGTGGITDVLRAEERGVHVFDSPRVTVFRYGKRAAGRRLDGIEHNGFPKP